MDEITIERLASQGDGVSADGVFAPFTLPGETARGAVVDDRMASPEIVNASDVRRTPPCAHFGLCGGCALQHGSDAFVAAWKRDQIAAALAARGIAGVEIRETATSPARSRRRATFTARRTRKTVVVGFHERAAAEVVGINACEVVRQELIAAFPAIEDAARLGASRKGAIRVAATWSGGGVDLNVDEAKPLDRSGLADAAALAETHDLARLTWNGELAALRRTPTQAFGVAKVAPPAGGFLQATLEGEAALTAAVAEAVGGVDRIADLFAGCGTFALPLAQGAEVHAVEGERASLEALEGGWRGAIGLKRVTTETRDLFRRPLEPLELKAFGAVVFDPPRAGAAAQSDALARSARQGGPSRIAAVSCNPATFARDARTLIDGGYRLDWVLPVDQFRWSPHVELAAQFSLE